MYKVNEQDNLTSHGTNKVPWLTLSLSVLMVGLYLFGQAAFDLLIFNKVAVMQGEVWRIITGHFVHISSQHLFWDLLAFVILGSVIELHNSRHLLPSFFLSCIGVSLWLFIGEEQLSSYCGLSGALNGLLVLAAVTLYKKTDDKIYLYVLLATIFKIIFEFFSHQTIFTNLASLAVPSAHAAGYIAGIVYLLLLPLEYKSE